MPVYNLIVSAIWEVLVKSSIFSDQCEISSYIPIACHYSRDSLLTKQGDLLQIVKIDGFEGNKDFTPDSGAIRDVIRKFLVENAKEDYWIYIQTIRERKNIVKREIGLEGFCSDLHNEWTEKNNWDKQLANSIYVIFVKQGRSSESLSLKNIGKVLFRPLIKKSHTTFFKSADIELTEITDKLIQQLDNFGASRLSIVERDGRYFSQQLRFYNKILLREDKEYEVPIQDLSECFDNTQVKHGFNHMEISDGGHTNNVAVFSLKEYTEVPIYQLNKFLQLGSNFVVTESFHFIPHSIATTKHKEVMEIYEISNDDEILEPDGIQEFIAHSNNQTEYCKHQITIVVYSDLENLFQDKVGSAVKVFNEIGIPFVREDFNMARCFWSQLPGNTKYFTRTSYIKTSKAASFASIHQDIIGNYKGSKWGDCITIFRTIPGTPYYFNFHDINGNGNTLILGPADSGKTILIRFLLARARRLNVKILYIDLEGSSEKFTSTIGGKHFKLSLNSPSPIKLNPFNIRGHDDKKAFAKWLTKAMLPSFRRHEDYEEFFGALAKKITEAGDNIDALSYLSEVVKVSSDISLEEGFKNCMGNPLFANFFSYTEEYQAVFNSSDVVSIDFSEMLNNPQMFGLFFNVFTHKLLQNLTGQPTIVVINRFAQIYDNTFLNIKINKWLEGLNKQDAILVTSIQDDIKLHKNQDFKELIKHFGTQIFISDKYADKALKKTFNLKDSEMNKIKSYNRSKRAFLLKHSNDSLMASADLSDMPEILEAFK